MSFLREAAVDLIIAMQKHGIPKELETQLTRLCLECSRSAETETAMLKRKHSCPDWDYMVIDEDSPEFESCLCYTEPVKEWVGLTDEELQDIAKNFSAFMTFGFARAIEAKLKEKNSGSAA